MRTANPAMTMRTITNIPIDGIVLAGGLSSRMGRDKALLPWHGRTLLEHTLDRLRSEAAFAHLCGAAPVPASSGKTTRHRLNWGGDRQANSALHMIAVVRLPLLLTDSGLCRATHNRGPLKTRDPALPQALHRTRDLPVAAC